MHARVECIGLGLVVKWWRKVGRRESRKEGRKGTREGGRVRGRVECVPDAVSSWH